MIAFHLTEDQATVPVNQPKTYLILSYLFTNFKEKEYVFKFSDEQLVDSRFKYIQIEYFPSCIWFIKNQVPMMPPNFTIYCVKQDKIVIPLTRDTIKTPVKLIQQPENLIELQIVVPGALKTATKATVAIIFKYFQVVDLLMNFFSKINVELGKNLQDHLDFLNNAEFPQIGFLQKASFSDDGGQA